MYFVLCFSLIEDAGNLKEFQDRQGVIWKKNLK